MRYNVVMAQTKIKIKITRKKITDTIELFKRGKYSWLNITHPDKAMVQYLQKHYKIKPDDLEDTLPPLQRSKILARKEYIFIVFVFPIEKGNKTIHPTQVDFFIFKDTVITIHQNQLKPLKIFPTEQIHEEALQSFSPPYIINHILEHLYEYCLPLSNKLGTEIDEVENKIYKIELADRSLIEKVFSLDREVIDFRKIMRSHKIIIEKLVSLLPKMTAKGSFPHDLLQDLREWPVSIWTNLESHMEAIDALQDTYESLTSYRLNEVIRILTIISVIISPLALVAGVFGMNFKFIPFASHPAGFFVTSLLMLIFTLFGIIFFKKKNWL